MLKYNPQRNIAGSLKWRLAILMAVFVSVALLWWQNRHLSDTVTALPASSMDEIQADAPMPASAELALPETESALPGDELEMVEAQQLRAAQAAIKAGPVAGLVSKRPEFVSEIEWKVLQDVAERHSELDQQLTHLINKLLFFKKRDAWMVQTVDSERRRALARDLLDMLPSQVDARSLDPDFARKMKSDLLTCLSQDAR